MSTLEIKDLHVSVVADEAEKEILTKISVPEVRERLEAAIEAELEAVGI